jgi:hypothetical protein
MDDVGQFSQKLMCRWLSWRAEGPGRLRLDLPDLDCTDMTGTVDTAKSLMPEVTVVSVYAGGKLDVVYANAAFADGGTEWTAFDHRLARTV